ncbi:MAG: chloramphenicol acetyltransferase [Mangrovicoccus sp.]
MLDPKGPSIQPDCEITDAQFGGFTEIGYGSRIAHSEFGDFSYCDRHCDIANTSIGKFVNIASFVRIGATDHPMDRASQHHFLYRSAKYWPDAQDHAEWFEKRRARRSVIGHDSWIGHAAQVKPEVTVGIGAVVASGAVVTRDVAPFMIVAGIPAQPIRARFPDPICERLLALAWWDWPSETLRAALEDFRSLSVEAFLDRYET